MTILHHISRRLSYTEEQLDQVVQEFADYAALDIADILKLHLTPQEQDYRLSLIATEVAHAIRCTVGTLTVTAAPVHPYRAPDTREHGAFEPLRTQQA